MRQPHFVPVSRPVDDFLSEMRADKIKLAIVIDEFGGTAGLVTLEDLVEEIVGSFPDERDMEHLCFEIGDLEVRIDGSVPISEINERLGLGIPKDLQHTTIGGYLLGQLGRIARVGDEVKVENGADSGPLRWIGSGLTAWLSFPSGILTAKSRPH